MNEFDEKETIDQTDPKEGIGAAHYMGYHPPPPYGYYQGGPQPPHDPYQNSANNDWRQYGNEWDFENYANDGSHTKKNRKSVVIVVSLLCVVALALCFFSTYALFHYVTTGSLPAGYSTAEEPPADPEPSASHTAPGSGIFEIAPPPAAAGEAIAEDGSLTTAQVAEKVTPVVVGVVTYDNSQRFIQPRGSGSGIIMSADGYILTNAHVLEDAAFVRVLLSDETSYEATIVGQDARTDLAVLKVDAENLPVAVFGDSDALRVGDTVIAIGNPTGMLSGTVTKGIVSALNRNIRATSRYAISLIQTDAAINPGNSGGALVNVYGQVVGIPSAKIIAAEFEGLGFAIPITDAKPIIDDLLEYGRVTGRVMLGISGEVVDEVTARTHDVPMGIQVAAISPDTDIFTKDVRVGDIITHINGERVYTFEEVWAKLDEHTAGDLVMLTIYRQTGILGDSFDVEVILQEDLG